MLTCKQVTKIQLEEEYGKLSFMKKLQFRIHLLICKTCRAFLAFNKTLEGTLHALYKERGESSDKIIKNIQDKADQSLLKRNKKE